MVSFGVLRCVHTLSNRPRGTTVRRYARSLFNVVEPCQEDRERPPERSVTHLFRETLLFTTTGADSLIPGNLRGAGHALIVVRSVSPGRN